jgi:hypothetical protein
VRPEIIKEDKETFGSDGYVYYLITIIYNVKAHQIVSFKYAQIIECQLYLNKL